MDSLQRMQGMFGKGSVDRVGLHDHYWPETTQLWMDQGYATHTDAEGNRQPDDPALVFDYDMRSVGGWFDLAPIRGFSEVLDETDEWIVRRTGSGAAFKYWKHKSGTPEHVDFLMKSREIWERDYRPHLLELDRGRANVDGTRETLDRGRADRKWTFYGHQFIWETLRGSLGDVCMYESLSLDPGWIHDFCRVYTDLYKAHYALLFDEAGVPDGMWMYEDLGYRNGLFASPRTLSKLIFPYFAELVAFFHERGCPVVLHSCGNFTQALPLIVDAGFDAVNPMEVKAGCDILKMAEDYGDRLVFVGGLDVRILETNDPAEVERGVRLLVEEMKSRDARLVFGTDHSITPLVRYDTYRLAVDVCRKYGAY